MYCATRHAAGARESQEVMEGCDGWRRPHPEQPLGGTDGCRTRQHGGTVASSRPREHTEAAPLGMGRAGRVLHQMIKNQVSDPIARRGVRLQPATLLFALIVVRSSTNAITLPLRVDGLRLEVGGRVNPDALRLHTDLAVTPARAQIALKWCREFVPSISSSAHGQEEVGAGWLAPDGQDDLAP